MMVVFLYVFVTTPLVVPGDSAAGRQLGQLPRLATEEVRDARARVLTT